MRANEPRGSLCISAHNSYWGSKIQCHCTHYYIGLYNKTHQCTQNVFGAVRYSVIVLEHGGYVVGHRSVGGGDRGSKPSAVVSKRGQFCSPHFQN